MTKQRMFDSNQLIYYLNASLNKSTRQQIDDAIEMGVFISVMSRIEVLGWTKHTENSLSTAKKLLNLFKEHSLNEEKVPNAIIAVMSGGYASIYPPDIHFNLKVKLWRF